MYPVHFSSKVPFRYKRNVAGGELHRAMGIASNFQSNKTNIKANFLKANFHVRSMITLSMISVILKRNLSYQDGFLMEEKQL